jgi:hypothetical protein
MAAFSGSGWFLKGLTHLLKGDVDFETDDIILIPCSAIPDQTADEFVDDLTEINSPSSRSDPLSSVSFNEDTTNLEVEIDAADATMPSIPNAASYIGYVVAKDTGVDGTSICLFWVDTDNKTGNGGDISVEFDAEGICKLTESTP